MGVRKNLIAVHINSLRSCDTFSNISDEEKDRFWEFIITEFPKVKEIHRNYFMQQFGVKEFYFSYIPCQMIEMTEEEIKSLYYTGIHEEKCLHCKSNCFYINKLDTDGIPVCVNCGELKSERKDLKFTVKEDFSITFDRDEKIKPCGCDKSVPYWEPLDRLKQVIICHKCGKFHNLIYGIGREIWNDVQLGKYEMISPKIVGNNITYEWTDYSKKIEANVTVV